jgi:hypothetical protein
VRHVADGVDVDEEADAGDDAEHDEGEVVDGEGEVDVEAGDGDPGALDDGEREGRAGGLHEDPEPATMSAGSGEEQRDGRDEGARQLAAERSVDQEAGEGKQRDEPEQLRVHCFDSWCVG